MKNNRASPKAAVSGKTVVKLGVQEFVVREFEVVFPLCTRYEYVGEHGDSWTRYSRFEGEKGRLIEIKIEGVASQDQEYTLNIYHNRQLRANDIPTHDILTDLYLSTPEEFESAWRMMIDALTNLT